MLWSKAVDGEIVDDPPVWITEGCVLHLEGFQLAGIISGEPLYHGQCAWPPDLDLAHVADVEQADRSAHGPVLLEDARVLHRHFPAAKLDEFRTCRLVHRIQRRLFQAHRCWWCHGRISLRRGARPWVRVSEWVASQMYTRETMTC